MARIKGFFLSVDSMMSLVIAIAAIGLLFLPQHSSEPENYSYHLLVQKTDDNATIGFYLRQTQQALSFSKKFGKCSEEFLPTANGTPVESTPFNNAPDFEKQAYCGEA